MEVIMNFDYCDLESVRTGQLTCTVGCRFADEPNELYVIEMDVTQEGNVLGIKLYFNGHDCQYPFKEEEIASVIAYVESVIPLTEYADWLRGRLIL